MSRDELVDAYLQGRISRRTLVRRLVAAGVTTGAAVSYAHLLAPERAGAATAASDHYYDPPNVELKLATRKLRRARKSGKVAVELTTDKTLPYLVLKVFKRTKKGQLVRVGQKAFPGAFATSAGTKKLRVPVSGLGKVPPVRLVIKATYSHHGKGIEPGKAKTKGRLT